MIIVQLKGGLGNQLFQYAAALSLAAYHGTVVKVDIAELNRKDAEIGTIRGFDLQQIRLAPEVASETEIRERMPQTLPARLTDKLKPPHRRQVYKEADYHYDTHFFEAGSNIYLKGYRQSERYFKPIEMIIRDGFSLKPESVERVSAVAAGLRSSNSVSIHIRRGDYSNKQVADFHGVLGEDYYQQAIRYFESKLPGCRFYVFSDAPEWVAEQLSFEAPVEIISGEKTRTHFEDFHLISCCRHNVIANSTFSWWAAWLNEHSDKIVVAPKRWFNQAGHDTRDLIPQGWIRM